MRTSTTRHYQQLPQENGQATHPCEMGGREQRRPSTTLDDPKCGPAWLLQNSTSNNVNGDSRPTYWLRTREFLDLTTVRVTFQTLSVWTVSSDGPSPPATDPKPSRSKQRHIDIILTPLNLENAKTSVAPGIKNDLGAQLPPDSTLFFLSLCMRASYLSKAIPTEIRRWVGQHQTSWMLLCWSATFDTTTRTARTAATCSCAERCAQSLVSETLHATHRDTNRAVAHSHRSERDRGITSEGSRQLRRSWNQTPGPSDDVETCAISQFGNS